MLEQKCVHRILMYRGEELEVAYRKFEEAAALMDRVGCRTGKAECLEGFGKLYEAMGDRAHAIEAWEKAAGDVAGLVGI